MDAAREMMKKAKLEKEAKAKQLAAALKASKHKDQLLAMLRAKVGKSAPAPAPAKAAAPAKPLSDPLPPPPPSKAAAVMLPPPPKKVVSLPQVPASMQSSSSMMAPPPAKRKPQVAQEAGEEEAEETVVAKPSSASSLPGVLPGFKGMGSDDEDEEDEEQGREATTVDPALLAGFFDAEETLPEPEPEEAEAAPPPSSSALPMGFFDDPEADALAHNIDLKAKKESDLNTEWDQFQKFAIEVVSEEKDKEAEEEEQIEENDQRGELEQMYYAARLAGLMVKSEKRGKGNGSAMEETDAGDQAIPKAEEAPTLAEETEQTAASEISSMLMAKKKKRKKVLEEALEGDYVPLDPLVGKGYFYADEKG